MSLVNRLAAFVARRTMNRSLRFEAAAPALPPADARPRLAYLHVPFCESLCPYCSFHRVVYDEHLCRTYFAALRAEIGRYHRLGFVFDSLYVGGGTPTVLVDELAQTIALMRDRFPVRRVSVETNPNHLTEERLAALERAGVNRLSVGIQSFDDGLLRAVNRYDRCGSGELTARRLRSTLGRFDTVNADMMFNFPAQTEAMLERDLSVLAGTGVDQVTYYPLMVADTTRRLIEGSVGRVDFSREAALYRRIVERLAPAYERSTAWCFSRPRPGRLLDEYIVDNDEYAGLGSGAIGYLAGTCYANTFDIPEYVAVLGQGRLPLRSARRFSRREQARYGLLMRLFSGRLDTADFSRRHHGLWRLVGPELLAAGLAGGLRTSGPGIELTERGYCLWVVLMREFFTAVNNLRAAARRAQSDAQFLDSGRRIRSRI